MSHISDDHVDVKIQDGVVRGNVYKEDDGKLHYYSFTGVPYAKPPVGDLRFRDAQLIGSWTGIKDSRNQDDACFIQLNIVTKEIIGAEELTLNVFTPSLPGPQKKSLPVMVYIHQGGFQYGSACKDEHGPDFLVKKDVVHVTITYRLSLFGFLCLDIPECPGNMGLKDQVLALKWVQRNIKFFNGDPSNVTIFGTSAGSASVNYHLLSPMSAGLFHKAIMQSGSTLNPWAFRRNPIEIAHDIAKVLGITFSTHKDLLEKLQKRPTEELLNALFKLKPSAVTFFLPFLPVVEKKFDGVDIFLADEPVTLMSKGLFAAVPTIIGMCELESIFIRLLRPDVFKDVEENKNPERYINSLLNNTENPGMREKVITVYGEDEVNLPLGFFNDVDFVGGILYTAEQLSQANSKVYVYQFSHVGEFNYSKYFLDKEKPQEIATHLDELGYLVSAKFLPQESASKVDRLVKERMLRMWTDFAKYGNPTPAIDDVIKTIWQPLTKDVFNCLDIRSELTLMKNPFAKRRELWSHIYSLAAKLFAKK